MIKGSTGREVLPIEVGGKAGGCDSLLVSGFRRGVLTRSLKNAVKVIGPFCSYAWSFLGL